MSDELDDALGELHEWLERLVSDGRADAIRLIARSLYSDDVPFEVSTRSESASLEELLRYLKQQNPTLVQTRDAIYRMGHLATLVTAYRLSLQYERNVPLLQSGAIAQYAAIKAQEKNRRNLPARDAALMIAVREARKQNPGISWTKLTDRIVANEFRFPNFSDPELERYLSGRQIRRRADLYLKEHPEMSWIRDRVDRSPSK